MARLQPVPFEGITLRGELGDGATIEFPNVQIEIRDDAEPDYNLARAWTIASSVRVDLHVRPTPEGVLYRLVSEEKEISLEDFYNGSY